MRIRDGTSSSNHIDVGERTSAKHEDGAHRAYTHQIAGCQIDGVVLQHVTARILRPSALQAEQLADSALALRFFLPVVQICPKRSAPDEVRLFAGEHFKPVAAPVPYRVFVHAKKPRRLVIGIGAIDFDAPPVKPLCGHDLKRAFVDQPANIFDAPSGRARAKLDRLGEAPRFDASPPRRFADGNGTAWCEN